MKTSIASLPKRTQEDLYWLMQLILRRLPETQMIILFGSYATGKYVEYDRRIEFGIPTTFRSDYDLLIVTSRMSEAVALQKLDGIEDKYYSKPFNEVPIQLFAEEIRALNRYLEEGRYFYTQIRKEGIVIYDTGKFKLARRRKLKYGEIRKQAEEYFLEKYNRANSFFIDVKNAYVRKDYVQSSFYLHQACENLFNGTQLTFTLESNKQHNLGKLLNSVRKYSEDFHKIFTREPGEEKRLFELLKAAYVQARYNPGFEVTQADIDALSPKVERLLALVQRICTERIAEYEALSLGKK